MKMSNCCSATVVYGDICTGCHDHCDTIEVDEDGLTANERLTQERQVDQTVSEDELPDALNCPYNTPSDAEANDMGLSAMERETARCAEEYTQAIKRWAEAASRLIQRQVKVV